MAAREKQKQIKERFRAWVFTDPDRTERLVRLYNDLFNNLRSRLFDGSHLKFSGMSQAIILRPSQADAVWRCMSGGNTLLRRAGTACPQRSGPANCRRSGKRHQRLPPLMASRSFSRTTLVAVRPMPGRSCTVAGDPGRGRSSRRIINSSGEMCAAGCAALPPAMWISYSDTSS